MPAETRTWTRAERRLAVAGVAGFGLIAIVAAALWAREGSLIYIARLLGDLPNCL